MEAVNSPRSQQKVAGNNTSGSGLKAVLHSFNLSSQAHLSQQESSPGGTLGHLRDFPGRTQVLDLGH